MTCGATVAQADRVEACVNAVEGGQKLQRAGKLGAARATFLACDKVDCPAEVRAVCDRLVLAVEAAQPTVILGARDATGKDLVAVRVSVDGAPLTESLDGKAVPIDPGPHVVRFEHAGDAPVEENVVIREAEKLRPIVVSFAASAHAAAVLPATSGAPAPAVTTLPAERSSVSPLVYALAGVSVVSFGVFVGLDVDGQSRFHTCQTSGCSSSTVSSLSIERDATIAMGAVGVVSLGLAVWRFVAGRGQPAPSTALRFDIDATHGGAVLGAASSF